MQIQPYLFFDGRCDEAIAFYRAALGAETVMLLRYKDAPPSVDRTRMPAGMDDKVMHARIDVGGSVLLLSDGQCTGTEGFRGFSLSIMVADPAEAGRVFAALAEGGTVQMPLDKTFFSPAFGMVRDRFGLGWMVYVAA